MQHKGREKAAKVVEFVAKWFSILELGCGKVSHFFLTAKSKQVNLIKPSKPLVVICVFVFSSQLIKLACRQLLPQTVAKDLRFIHFSE